MWVIHLNALAACLDEAASLVAGKTNARVTVSIEEVASACGLGSARIAALLSACPLVC